VSTSQHIIFLFLGFKLSTQRQYNNFSFLPIFSSMETLFTTNENDLEQLFDILPEEDIQECCSSKVYYRGIDYFENGCVRSAEFNTDKTLLTAKVKGSQIYTVQVSLKNKQVKAACTCLHDAICKHIVAAMVYATLEPVDTQSSDKKSKLNIKSYLNSLSKDELVELLIKYAPDEFFTVTNNKQSSSSEAQKIFTKAKRNVEDIFNDDEVMYDPDAFEGSLMKVIKSLSGLEKSIPKKLGELTLGIIQKVENATDKGYLYDHHGDYDFEPSEQFYEFVAKLAAAMDFSEKIEFIEKLDAAITNSSYSTFDDVYKWLGKYFKDEELPQLKTLLLNEYNDLPDAIVESYYGQVSSMLSDAEKEKILEILVGRNNSWAVELSELLNNTGKRKKSIPLLRHLIFGESDRFVDERLCFQYLDQLKAESLDLHEAALKCMNQCPTAGMLEKIVELLPMEGASCEQILEKKSPNELLNYLESSSRITDAQELVERAKKIWPDRIFTFYKRNKKVLPQKAAQYFRTTINENLKDTGDHYYHTIVDALKHLKQIDDKAASELILHLRQNYKRRSKLMALIDDL
jgi:hypothetical protein